MVFQAMPLFLSLRNQIAPILGNPFRVIKSVRKKKVGPDAPILMATYTEAANKFTKAAMEIMAYAHRLTAARNAYLLRQKECELVRLRREIDSLKIVIPLLVEDAPETQNGGGQNGAIKGERFDFVAP
jgi:hypothetical protein